MTAIATQIPEELVQIGDSVEAFCRVEVIGRHEVNYPLLSDPRNTYRLDGRYVDEVIAQIKEVRMASAKAGFYNVSVPEDLGGAGFGMLAYYYLIERI
ncbi:MAG: acyl-CoA dehydrogenase family protein [Alphaproteobacteria bacterium]|nr:acyl-CoA dehydrogenase family protein [Alphaproteobacteria bacterium]